MNQHISAENARLWAKLQAFSLDEPNVSFPFSARLARENDWSLDYTQRVIEEYKHFVFLAMTAGHPVTPSVDVDQVWHLHLSYTRSYWEELCGELFGKPLHHGPTKGGKAEDAKFTDWYNRTLTSYEQIFDSRPPQDIWPEAAIRLAPNSRIRQVSDRTHWVIRKPTVGRKGMIALTTLTFFITTGFITSTPQSDLLPFFFFCGFVIFGGVIFLIFVYLLLVFLSNLSSSGSSKKGGGASSGGDGGGGCGGCGG